MINLKYPVLLIHGMGFHDSERFCYWGRIPKMLREEGCTVYYGYHDRNGTIERSGRFLSKRILSILKECGAEKLNVIAHSKGGLDMRYAISSLGMSKFVASLTMIGTPNNGSHTMDKILKLPKWIVKATASVTDLVMRILGDKHPESYLVFKSYATEYAKEFNLSNPDSPDVYYQSYAFKLKNALGDIFMFPTYLILKICEGENDGLVAPCSVVHGNFRGIYTGENHRGISHLDQIDFRRRRFTEKEGKNVSDMAKFYKTLVSELAEMGF